MLPAQAHTYLSASGKFQRRMLKTVISTMRLHVFRLPLQRLTCYLLTICDGLHASGDCGSV